MGDMAVTLETDPGIEVISGGEGLPMFVLALIFLFLLIGSLVYCVLIVLAARKYLAVKLAASQALPPITIMKPLSGLDEGLYENLRSFFEQDYPLLEILFAVRHTEDPAVQVACKVMDDFPEVPARLIAVGESPSPNAKVYSLRRMLELAQYEIIAMADSDTRVDKGFLRVIAAEMKDDVGLVTCPYRAVAGDSPWSRLEAIGLNTEFLGGVLVARMLMGMDFALGPAIAARKSVLEQIGGLARLENYLAEDFVMGNLVAALGRRVILSSYRIEHRIGGQGFKGNLQHRLRWARSTRRSRRLGYLGLLFTNPLPLALLLCAVQPQWYPLAIAALLFRAAAAWAVAVDVLHDPLTRGNWWLVPVQDLMSFGVWIGGFFGRSINWRGRRYNIQSDGTYADIDSKAQAPVTR
jgi:ceramide glucosyltransferase